MAVSDEESSGAPTGRFSGKAAVVTVVTLVMAWLPLSLGLPQLGAALWGTPGTVSAKKCERTGSEGEGSGGGLSCRGIFTSDSGGERFSNVGFSVDRGDDLDPYDQVPVWIWSSLPTTAYTAPSVAASLVPLLLSVLPLSVAGVAVVYGCSAAGVGRANIRLRFRSRD